MERARFQIEITQRPDENGLPLQDGQRVAFDANGIDRVEFLVETNPGEGFKPLVKIASGGETSRLMLALKNVLANADKIPTLVFDEIDQGIGGRVGMVVGEKLWNLSHQHQVMCITHLPQLAAYGEQHYRVIRRFRMGAPMLKSNPWRTRSGWQNWHRCSAQSVRAPCNPLRKFLRSFIIKTGKVEDKSK